MSDQLHLELMLQAPNEGATVAQGFKVVRLRNLSLPSRLKPPTASMQQKHKMKTKIEKTL